MGLLVGGGAADCFGWWSLLIYLVELITSPAERGVTSRHDTQILDKPATNGLQQMFYSFVKFYDGEYVMMIG